MIGIKLYPALGFKPYPSSRQELDKYLEFYRWCVTNDIPITVHCQPVAYDPDDLTKTDQNSRPSYWQNVLKTEGLQTLRINFAHFGGGQNIPDLFDEHGNLRRDNETSLIIDMLRNYPHTYADLAAINFRNKKISEGFASSLTKDLQEEHGTKHSLCKKLIWGSDVPMVIESPQYHREQGGDGPEMGYIHSLRYFKNSIGEVRSIVLGLPDCISQTKQKVMQDIVSNNPERFLHG